MTHREEHREYSNTEGLRILKELVEQQEQTMRKIQETFFTEMFPNLPDVPEESTANLITKIHQAYHYEFTQRRSLSRLTHAIAQNDAKGVLEVQKDISWETLTISISLNEVLDLLDPNSDSPRYHLRITILNALAIAYHRASEMTHIISWWYPDSEQTGTPGGNNHQPTHGDQAGDEA